MAIYKNFTDIPNLFSDAIRDSGHASLFHSQQWYENYTNTIVPDKNKVSIFAQSSSGTPDTAVLLPLYDTEKKGILSPRRLGALANYYSSDFDPVWSRREEFPTAALHDMVSEISSAKPRWDQVRISPCRSDSIAKTHLTDAFLRHKWAIQEFHCYQNLYLKNIYHNFDSYLASRSSRIRKTAANRARKFDRDKSSMFNIITSTDDLDVGMEMFSILYKKRWNKSEPFPDFLPELAKVCAENGWLRLGIASIKGRPAAVQFWIVKDGIAYIYKVAYDEEFTKLSVGAVALFKMFQHVLDNESVQEIDFLTGDDAYKKDWMSDSRELVGVTAFNRRSIRGIASACWHIGGRTLKTVLANATKRKSQ